MLNSSKTKISTTGFPHEIWAAQEGVHAAGRELLWSQYTYKHKQDNNLLPEGSLSFGLSLHPLPQRVSVVSIHLDLTEEIKLGIVTFGKLFDLRFCPWFLNQTTKN